MKSILICYDDVDIHRHLVRLFSQYPDFEVREAVDAGECLARIREKLPDALIVEQRMLYGAAADEIGCGYEDDVVIWSTGANIIAWFKQHLLALGKLIDAVWIASLITDEFLFAQAEADLRIEGIAHIYVLPFDTILFEDDVCQALGIESKVHRLVRDVLKPHGKRS